VTPLISFLNIVLKSYHSLFSVRKIFFELSITQKITDVSGAFDLFEFYSAIIKF